MTKKSGESDSLKIQRPKRANLTAEESLKRMREFGMRKDRFIAAVREVAKR